MPAQATSAQQDFPEIEAEAYITRRDQFALRDELQKEKAEKRAEAKAKAIAKANATPKKRGRPPKKSTGTNGADQPDPRPHVEPSDTADQDAPAPADTIDTDSKPARKRPRAPRVPKDTPASGKEDKPKETTKPSRSRKTKEDKTKPVPEKEDNKVEGSAIAELPKPSRSRRSKTPASGNFEGEDKTCKKAAEVKTGPSSKKRPTPVESSEVGQPVKRRSRTAKTPELVSSGPSSGSRGPQPDPMDSLVEELEELSVKDPEAEKEKKGAKRKSIKGKDGKETEGKQGESKKKRNSTGSNSGKKRRTPVTILMNQHTDTFDECLEKFRQLFQHCLDHHHSPAEHLGEGGPQFEQQAPCRLSIYWKTRAVGLKVKVLDGPGQPEKWSQIFYISTPVKCFQASIYAMTQIVSWLISAVVHSKFGSYIILYI